MKTPLRNGSPAFDGERKGCFYLWFQTIHGDDGRVVGPYLHDEDAGAGGDAAHEGVAPEQDVCGDEQADDGFLLLLRVGLVEDLMVLAHPHYSPPL